MHCSLAPVHGGKVAWVKAGPVGLGHPDLSPLSPGTTPPQPGTAVVHGVLAAASGTSADSTSGRGEAERPGSCLPQLPEATQEDSGTKDYGPPWASL